MNAEFIVGGMAVPEVVLHIARQVHWTSHSTEAKLDPTIVEGVFGEIPDSTWRFYSVNEVREMTEDWHNETDAAWFGVAPENIDPRRSILIGELGYDRPFALDFRTSPPAVRLMAINGQWREVAASASALLTALHIMVED